MANFCWDKQQYRQGSVDPGENQVLWDAAGIRAATLFSPVKGTTVSVAREDLMVSSREALSGNTGNASCSGAAKPMCKGGLF